MFYMFGFWLGFGVFCYFCMGKYSLVQVKMIEKMKIFYYPLRFENCTIKLCFKM